MKYYPVYLDLRDRPCAVIGGGKVAERKTLSLLESGAKVTVISPSLTPKLHEMAQSGKINHVNKKFDENDLTGIFLVIAATDSSDVNTSVAHACRKNRVLVNTVSLPEESTFIVPSVVERGELVIAVSTSGASPALSRKIRQDLEKRYGMEYAHFFERIKAVRKKVLEEISDEQVRKGIFQSLVDSNVIELLRQGKTHEADLRIAEITGMKRWE